MEPILVSILNELKELSKAVLSTLPDDRAISVAHQNWSFPSISRTDLNGQVISISDLIAQRGETVPAEDAARLTTFPEKLLYLRANTVPQLWSSSHVAVPAFEATLRALTNVLNEVLPQSPSLEEISNLSKEFKRVRDRLRALSAELDATAPKTNELAGMISRIEGAHAAADQLPTDLADLAAKRDAMQKIQSETNQMWMDAMATQNVVEKSKAALEASLAEAKKVLEMCESAYSASTSVGLAAAFSERSSSLAWSMRGWVIGLLAALGVGGFFAAARFSELSLLIRTPEISGTGIAVTLLMSISSVGGAIWFAWVATKQIGQRFRLSEDYAFKASISRAYEGYRKESARIDPALEIKLLTSALQRLDELPLRLVETDQHGSPWSEALSSPLLRDAVNSVPGFLESVKSSAQTAMENLNRSKTPSGEKQ